MILPGATYTKSTAAANGCPRAIQDEGMEGGVIHPVLVGREYIFRGEELIAAQLKYGKQVVRPAKAERAKKYSNSGTIGRAQHPTINSRKEEKKVG